LFGFSTWGPKKEKKQEKSCKNNKNYVVITKYFIESAIKEMLAEKNVSMCK